MHKRAVNEGVNITAWYFRNKRGLSTYPRRMEYNGSTYTFMDGLQYLVKKGESVMHIFDMNDGANTYRLRCDDSQSTWTLVAITEIA